MRQKKGFLFATVLVLANVSMSAQAPKTVYRWVDDNGVTHYSDVKPEGVTSYETQIIEPSGAVSVEPDEGSPTTPAAPPHLGQAGSAEGPALGSPNRGGQSPPSTVTERPAIDQMSLEDLDRRCEEARERKIRPLREAEIARCKEDKRNDPAWCERFNADFGEGGRTVAGTVRPRMFDDLHECVDALSERNRRGR